MKKRTKAAGIAAAAMCGALLISGVVQAESQTGFGDSAFGSASLGGDMKLDASSLGGDMKLDSSSLGDGLKLDSSSLGSDMKLDSSSLGDGLKLDSSSLGSDMKLDSSSLKDGLKLDSSSLGSDMKLDSSSLGSGMKDLEAGNTSSGSETKTDSNGKQDGGVSLEAASTDSKPLEAESPSLDGLKMDVDLDSLLPKQTEPTMPDISAMRLELGESMKANASETLKEAFGEEFKSLDENLFGNTGIPKINFESLNIRYASMISDFRKDGFGKKFGFDDLPEAESAESITSRLDEVVKSTAGTKDKDEGWASLESSFKEKGWGEEFEKTDPNEQAKASSINDSYSSMQDAFKEKGWGEDPEKTDPVAQAEASSLNGAYSSMQESFKKKGYGEASAQTDPVAQAEASSLNWAYSAMQEEFKAKGYGVKAEAPAQTQTAESDYAAMQEEFKAKGYGKEFNFSDQTSGSGGKDYATLQKEFKENGYGSDPSFPDESSASQNEMQNKYKKLQKKMKENGWGEEYSIDASQETPTINANSAKDVFNENWSDKGSGVETLSPPSNFNASAKALKKSRENRGHVWGTYRNTDAYKDFQTNSSTQAAALDAKSTMESEFNSHTDYARSALSMSPGETMTE